MTSIDQTYLAKLLEKLVIERCEDDIANALRAGYHKAHKHTAKPSEQHIIDTQYEYITNALYEALGVVDDNENGHETA